MTEMNTKSRDGWIIFDNRMAGPASQAMFGMYDAMAYNHKKVRECELIFVDPMKPTDEEWILFILDYGSGVIEKGELL